MGFGLRGYPLSATAFTWGALMGIGTLLVIAFASIRPGFSQASWAGHFLWIAIALGHRLGLLRQLSQRRSIQS